MPKSITLSLLSSGRMSSRQLTFIYNQLLELKIVIWPINSTDDGYGYFWLIEFSNEKMSLFMTE